MKHKTQKTTVEKRKASLEKYNNSDERKAKMREYYQQNKDKWRHKHIEKTYGITVEDYNKMLTEQSNSCYTCGVHVDSAGKNGLVIDHCHTSGKVRSLLCSNCNSALGLVNEDINRMKKLIEYLEKHNPCG